MQGKTVLVTGGAKRVGAAIVRRLHAAGANVAIHCHASLYDALALRAELNEKRPDSACTVQADLLDVSTLPRVVEETVKQFGHLDAVVNNASSFYPTPLDKMNEQQWNDLLGTNLKAPLFLAQAAASELRHRHGCIVNIVDIHAEATSEKIALGRYLDGLVSAVLGTHTHVQTADERILPNGTGFITDLGMTGPIQSVLGVKPELVIQNQKTKMPVRFDLADGDCHMDCVLFEIEEKNGKTISIERLRIE